jgi:signal transduction histidine kinase
VVAGGEVEEHEARWVTSSGEIVHVLWSCTPLPPFATGPAWLISGDDVTIRRGHEEELRRSRARIVAAGDEARKRLERNLHDGAQQRLTSLLLYLRLARSKVSEPPVQALLDQAIEELGAAVTELRELARGIHPEVLTRRGLAAALRVVTTRMPVPVELEVPRGRFGESTEAAAYYVVSESLANIVKYAQASSAAVRVQRLDGRLIVEVSDDGIGGADASAGTGLSGLADRVAALEGGFSVDSPAGAGTRVRAEIPLR